MTTKELIQQYVTAHADNRWMDASELEALLTEFAEKLQEPASEDIEQELEAFIKSGKAKKEENFGNFTTTHIDPLKIARHFAEWGSAHLTNKASKFEGEDLVDATNNYCLTIRKGYPRVKDKTDVFICNAFKAGAQWQERKDIEDSFKSDMTMPNKFFEAGARWDREQMMEDAVEIKINRDTLYDLKPLIHERYLDYKIGQKVKIIILPSDNK